MTDTPTDLDRPTVRAVVESLTGFDELAIETMFRKAITDLGGTLSARACAFIVARRAGATDQDAFRTAMSTPLGELNAQFSPEADADVMVDEDDPGKA